MTTARPEDGSPIRYDRWARPSVRTVSKMTASEGCDIRVTSSAKECWFARASPPKPAPTALCKNLRRENMVIPPIHQDPDGEACPAPLVAFTTANDGQGIRRLHFSICPRS